MRVRLYSVGTEIVSTENDDDIRETKGSRESFRHQHVCKLRPLNGKTSCSYYLSTEKLKNLNVKLVDWSKAKATTTKRVTKSSSRTTEDANLPRF